MGDYPPTNYPSVVAFDIVILSSGLLTSIHADPESPSTQQLGFLPPFRSVVLDQEPQILGTWTLWGKAPCSSALKARGLQLG